MVSWKNTLSKNTKKKIKELTETIENQKHELEESDQITDALHQRNELLEQQLKLHAGSAGHSAEVVLPPQVKKVETNTAVVQGW